MEEVNVWIFFFHIEEFFNNLDSVIITRVDGLFGYPWLVIDIDKIQFTQDMNLFFLPRQTIKFSNDCIAMYDTYSFSQVAPFTNMV